MKKLMMIFAAGAAIVMTGCSVTKVEYEKNDKGEISYRIYRNSHWLKMDAEGMSGGMSEAGKFEIALDGMKASPSEEFNKTMQTYTSAVVSLAQIAAAAYNPSASAATKSAAQSASGTTVPAIKSNANVTTAAAQSSAAAECEGGSCTDKADCKDGSCADKADCKDGSCTDKADCKDGSCETTSPARATDGNSDSDTSHKEPAGTAGETSGQGDD